MMNKNDSCCTASAIQRQFWAQHQLNPENSAHTISSLFRIVGPFDHHLLKKSLNQIVKRHTIFRTVFDIGDGALKQRIFPELIIEVPVVINQCDDIALATSIREEVQKPFNLSTGPLIRACVFHSGEKTSFLLIVMHHIIVDLRTKDLFGIELSTLYNAYASGEKPFLEEPAFQYSDYAVHHQEWLQSDAHLDMVSFWANQLKDTNPFIDLPSDYSRPGIQSLKGNACTFDFSRRFTDDINRFSRKNNVNAFLFLLSVYFLILHRYSRQDNLTVGVPLSNRRQDDFKNVMGCFVNIVPIAVDVSDNPGFLQVLKRVRAAMLGAHRHQELPVETMLEKLRPKRDMSYNPFYQAGFTFEPPMKLELNGLDVEPVHCHSGGSQLDIFGTFWEAGQKIRGYFEYCTDLYTEETIKRFYTHYVTLIESVIKAPELRISQFEMITDDEKDTLLNRWNATGRKYPDMTGIHRLFENQVEKTPDATALVNGICSLSYRMLNHYANSLAHFLIDRGIRPETPVGIFMERSIEMVVAIYGIVKSGGAYVPLDPEYPASRISYMIEETDVPIILTQKTIAGKIPETRSAVLCLDSDWGSIAGFPRDNPVDRTAQDNAAYIIYTSGSTGKPKGVVNSHRGILNRIMWMQDEYRLDETDSVLQKTAYSFDVSVWEFFWPLAVGAKLVVAPPGSHKDPAHLARIINEHAITTIHFVPSMLRTFLENTDPGDSKSLKEVFSSGEALSRDLEAAFFQRLKARLHNLYGPTEAAVDVTYWECGKNDDGMGKSNYVPIGKPVANTRIYILDNGLNPVPVGVPGEIYIGGVQVAKGYLNRPELTDEKFIRDPFSSDPSDRLYKTGDLAKFRADGAVDYIGRTDFQVKIHGIRVELGEIESVLVMHEGIARATVIAKDFGRLDRRIVAYMVPDNTHAYTVRQLQVLKKQDENGIYYDLPNNMTVSHISQQETDSMFKRIFENRAVLQHGVRLKQGACIFDVGANIGLFSLFAGMMTQGRIFAFETIPARYNALKTNAALYEFDIVPMNCCLSSGKSTSEFSLDPNSSTMSESRTRYGPAVKTPFATDGSLDAEHTGISHQSGETGLPERLTERFPGCVDRTVSDVIADHGIQRIDLLRVDAEKNAAEVLAGIHDRDWTGIGQVWIEGHDGDGGISDIKTLLEKKGYTIHADSGGTNAPAALYAVQPGYDPSPEAAPPGHREEGSPWRCASSLLRDVQKSVRDRLPDYMVPSVYMFLDEIPLTGSGKVNRLVLPEPDVRKMEPRTEYVCPANSLQQRLADLWQRLLKKDHIGIHDNFFDVGGNSLLSAYMASEINKQFPKHVSVITIFQYPTINTLAQFLAPTEEETRKASRLQNRANLVRQSFIHQKGRKRV